MLEQLIVLRKMVRPSVASDHHPTRTEASVVLCVEVPENALVSDGDQIDDGQADDNDNDEDTTVPSGSAWQVDSIEICEAATVEPPTVHCQDQDYDNNGDSVSPSAVASCCRAIPRPAVLIVVSR